MRTFALSLLAVVSLVVSSGCCCCGGGGMRQSCGYRSGCGATYSPCGGGCSPCGNGGGYGGTYAPGGAPAVIGPQQGTMLTPTSSTSAYVPANNQISAVPLESLPTY